MSWRTVKETCRCGQSYEVTGYHADMTVQSWMWHHQRHDCPLRSPGTQVGDGSAVTSGPAHAGTGRAQHEEPA